MRTVFSMATYRCVPPAPSLMSLICVSDVMLEMREPSDEELGGASVLMPLRGSSLMSHTCKQQPCAARITGACCFSAQLPRKCGEFLGTISYS